MLTMLGGGGGRRASVHRYLVVFLTGIVLGQFLSGPFTLRNSSASSSRLMTLSNNDNKHIQDDTTSMTITTTTTTTTNKKKLADGCYHVLLDVGSNIGVHGRFLFEPQHYPKAKRARQFFDEHLGTPASRDNRDLCVFAFEPNPNHYARLHNVSAAYAARGWRYHVLTQGVSDADDVIQFYPRNDKEHMEWGFSAVPHGGKQLPGVQPIDVPVVRLASWIQEHVHDRQLPVHVYGNYTHQNDDNNNNTTTTTTMPQPKVLMKMDIEGLEYRVMPDLLASGVFCNTIDAAFGEVHRQFFPQTLGNGMVLHNGQEGMAYWNALMLTWPVSPWCKGKFMQGDDESYLKDGIPLPQS